MLPGYGGIKGKENKGKWTETQIIFLGEMIAQMRMLLRKFGDGEKCAENGPDWTGNSQKWNQMRKLCFD